MAASNTNLHNYNHELVQCIEDLKRKRDEVNRQIEQVSEQLYGCLRYSLSLITKYILLVQNIMGK